MRNETKRTKTKRNETKRTNLTSFCFTHGALQTIPTIKKNSGSDSNKDSKVFKEVQEAMKRNPLEKLQEGEWANETLMQTIAKNPRLAMGLSNPRFSRAIQEVSEAGNGCLVLLSAVAALLTPKHIFESSLSCHITAPERPKEGNGEI